MTLPAFGVLAKVLLGVALLVVALAGYRVWKDGEDAASRHRLGLVLGLLGILVASAVLVVFPDFGAQDRASKGQRPSAEALAFLEGGRPRTLAEFQGKVVVIDYWASWCPPCRRSLPEVAGLQRRAEQDHSFVVIPINLDEDPAKLAAFLAGEGAALVGPAFRYARPAGPRLMPEGLGPEIRGIPTTLIIDREGGLAMRWSGYREGEVGRGLDSILKEP